MKKFFFITLMFCFILPAAIFAQSATTGAITGVVVDNEGAPLPGATITALHIPTGTLFTAVTRSNGRFFIPSVKVGGPYTVTALLESFTTEEKKNVTVKLGEKKDLKFMMYLETIQAKEIIVTASTPIILLLNFPAVKILVPFLLLAEVHATTISRSTVHRTMTCSDWETVEHLVVKPWLLQSVLMQSRNSRLSWHPMMFVRVCSLVEV